MRLIYSICFLAFLSSLTVGTTSCTKENIKRDTITVKDTIILKDTLIIKDTAFSAELLTAHPWRLQEVLGVVANDNLFYVRGGSNNTESFDNEFITFNTNKTGVHTFNNGMQASFTWQFVNAEHTKLTWTVYNTPATFTYTWDNIRYKNKSIYFDQYYTDGNTGKRSHSQNIRIPFNRS